MPGDIVSGSRGWQTHSLSRAKALSQASTRDGTPLSAYLGVLGMPGTTAYSGMTDIGEPKAGRDGGGVGGVGCGRLDRRADRKARRRARGRRRRRRGQVPVGAGDARVRRLRRPPRARPAPRTCRCLPERHRRLFRERRRRGAGGGLRVAQPVCARGDVRHGVAVQRARPAARPESRLRRRQEGARFRA